MELYDSMSANKGSSIISGNDASNRDSMLDGKNLLFMTGFSAGMLFFYLAGDTFCKEAGQMYLETLRQIKRMDPAMEGLFLYILKSRIRQALLLFILATGKLSKPVFYIVFAIAGFITGILMLIAAYQLGFLGILISVGMVFPQMIFYFMAFKLMFDEYYYSDTNNYHKSNAIIQSGWHKIGIIFLRFFKCILYILLGVFLETYINSWLMQKILLFL